MASRCLGVLFSLALLTVLGTARTNSFGQDVATRPPVTGTILDPSGRPLSGVEVRLAPIEEAGPQLAQILSGATATPLARTETAADGAFRLDAPRPGLYRILVSSSGFVAVECGPLTVANRLELPPLAVEKSQPFAVQILDPDRRPLAGGLVVGRQETRDFDPPAGLCRPLPVTGVSDHQGRVTLPGPADRRLKLTAGANGLISAGAFSIRGRTQLRLGKGRSQPVQLLLPNGSPAAGTIVATPDRLFPLGIADSAGRFTAYLPESAGLPVRLLGPGPTFGAATIRPAADPVRITLEAARTVDGQVIDRSTKKPIGGAQVFPKDQPQSSVLTGGDGRFQLEVPPAAGIDLAVKAAGYRTETLNHLPPHSTAVVIPLRPAAALAGRVRDSLGRPVSGAQVVVSPGPAYARPTPILRRRPARSEEQATTLCSPLGVFHFIDLPPGRPLLLNVSAPGFAPLAVPVPPLQPQEIRAGLALVLPAGREISGRVTDPQDRPLPGVPINLEAEPQEAVENFDRLFAGEEKYLRTGVTDREGRFRLSGLPAAPLLLSAKFPGLALRHKLRIEGREGTGPIDAGTVVLEPAIPLTGTVLDPSGVPLADVEIQATPPGDTFPNLPFRMEDPIAVSGADGRFTIPDCLAGSTIDLSLRHPLFQPAFLAGVKVPPLQPLVTTLRPLARLGVKVVDPDGQGIGGAEVMVILFRASSAGLTSVGRHEVLRFECDQQGRVEPQLIAPGRAQLSVIAPTWEYLSEVETTVAEGKVNEVTLTLKPGAALHGQVRTTAGEPAVGAEVNPTVNAARWKGEILTDGAGRYRIEGLPIGKTGIEATLSGHARAVKTIELQPGPNQLDLELPEGLALSGVVRDEDQAPVAGAEVTARSAGGTFADEARMVTAADGAFELAGLPPGSFALQASAPGFAPGASQTISLNASPIRGIQIQLTRGATLSGRILGLPAELFPRTQVFAYNNPETEIPRVASPGADGRFRIDNLGPGDWIVIAQVDQRRTSNKGQLTIAPGQSGATLDLTFDSGLTLSGTVRFGAEPLAGAMLFLEGGQPFVQSGGGTDYQGDFSVGGLQPGTYDLQVQHYGTGLVFSTQIELAQDRTIELRIPQFSLSGIVVQSDDRRPVAEAEVEARPTTQPRIGRLSSGPSTTTDAEGRFQLGGIGPGTIQVTARKAGMVPGQKTIALAEGAQPGPILLALEPGAGFALRVRWAGGGIPHKAHVLVLTPQGGTIVRRFYSLGEDGSLTIPEVPRGRWVALIHADGSAIAAAEIQVPAPPLEIGLLPSCRLEVEVPALTGGNQPGGFRVQAGDGTPFRAPADPGGFNSIFSLVNGHGVLDQLPPGVWLVEAWGIDGRSWSGVAQVNPEGPNRVVLTDPD